MISNFLCAITFVHARTDGRLRTIPCFCRFADAQGDCEMRVGSKGRYDS